MPGQYVRVGVDIDGVRHWRTYSLTSVPRRRDGRIAITVKRIAGGLVSEHLVAPCPPGHAGPARAADRRVRPPGSRRASAAVRHRRQRRDAGHGDAARARGPPDGFPTSRTCTSRPSFEDTIFGGELRALAREHPGYTLHEHHDDRDGRWDVAELDRRVPDWRERETWACGPAGLLDALTDHFARAGVSERLHLEHFRPVAAAAGRLAARAAASASSPATRRSRPTATTPLLVAGEQAGALLPHGCRMGICNSCIGRLRSGAVRDLRTGDVQHADDQMVRTCVSAAAGPIEIDL